MAYKLGNRIPWTKKQDFGGQPLFLLENLFNVRADERLVPKPFRENPELATHLFIHALDSKVVLGDPEFLVPANYGIIPPLYINNRFSGFTAPDNVDRLRCVIVTTFEEGPISGSVSKYQMFALLKNGRTPTVYAISETSKHVMIYKNIVEFTRSRMACAVQGFRLLPSMGEVLFDPKYLGHLINPQFEGQRGEDEEGEDVQPTQ